MSLSWLRTVQQTTEASVGRRVRQWPGLLVRFSSISALSTLTYAAVLILAAVVAGIDGKAAIALAYFAALPMNFFGHRRFTFRSDAHVATQILKFIFVHALILALSTAVMALSVDYFRMPVLAGLVLSTAAIMVLSFLLLNSWVFKKAT